MWISEPCPQHNVLDTTNKKTGGASDGCAGCTSILHTRTYLDRIAIVVFPALELAIPVPAKQCAGKRLIDSAILCLERGRHCYKVIRYMWVLYINTTPKRAPSVGVVRGTGSARPPSTAVCKTLSIQRTSQLLTIKREERMFQSRHGFPRSPCANWDTIIRHKSQHANISSVSPSSHQLPIRQHSFPREKIIKRIVIPAK